jgi:hypothetical protein
MATCLLCFSASRSEYESGLNDICMVALSPSRPPDGYRKGTNKTVSVSISPSLAYVLPKSAHIHSCCHDRERIEKRSRVKKMSLQKVTVWSPSRLLSSFPTTVFSFLYREYPPYAQRPSQLIDSLAEVDARSHLRSRRSGWGANRERLL